MRIGGRPVRSPKEEIDKAVQLAHASDGGFLPRQNTS